MASVSYTRRRARHERLCTRVQNGERKKREQRTWRSEEVGKKERRTRRLSHKLSKIVFSRASWSIIQSSVRNLLTAWIVPSLEAFECNGNKLRKLTGLLLFRRFCIILEGTNYTSIIRRKSLCKIRWRHCKCMQIELYRKSESFEFLSQFAFIQ